MLEGKADLTYRKTNCSGSAKTIRRRYFKLNHLLHSRGGGRNLRSKEGKPSKYNWAEKQRKKKC